MTRAQISAFSQPLK